MNFNFDQVIDRSHSHSAKWNFPELFMNQEECAAQPLPMWVADMDFRVPPAVQEALAQAVEHGIFGYSRKTPGYTEAVMNWQLERFGWQTQADWIVQTPGVVAALAQIVQAFTHAGDCVLVQMPVYGPFHKIPRLNGREVIDAPLRATPEGYVFDAQIFEETIKTHRPRLFILCNPHNPTGNVWSHADLSLMGEICAQYQVLVIADEIHQDWIFNRAKKHIPFASINEAFAQNSLTCTAPSKTFNIAGLQISNIFVPNPNLRRTLQHQLVRSGIETPSQLGLVACEAAYRHGVPWLEQLLDYVRDNHAYLAEKTLTSLAPIKYQPTDALYLAWLDCRELFDNHADLQSFMLKDARLWLDTGSKFGSSGQGYMRMNLACPRSILEEGVQRLERALQQRKK